MNYIATVTASGGCHGSHRIFCAGEENKKSKRENPEEEQTGSQAEVKLGACTEAFTGASPKAFPRAAKPAAKPAAGDSVSMYPLRVHSI